MTDDKDKLNQAPAKAAVMTVANSPHVANKSLSTRRMMLDVLIGLSPVFVVSVIVFRQFAIYQTLLAVAGCLATEFVFAAARKKAFSLKDCSAVVTGVILAMSMPCGAPWYVTVIGAVMAIALGKMIFGGLGQNLFNPAMVGRAFVMICFASAMGAGAYQTGQEKLDSAFLSQATPMTIEQELADARAAGEVVEGAQLPSYLDLFVGKCGGSLGEISALACLLGGAYLLIRRTAAWQIPLGMLGAVLVISVIMRLANGVTDPAYQLLGGAVFFGAFFIATDPVSSPLTPKGRLIFGIGVGTFVMIIRHLSNYPEGVMFAVLLMNSVVPLINRWTIPRPLGGPVPEKN
jgi:electron transport complex protein RnfD